MTFLINSFMVEPADTSFTVGTMTGTHVQNTEGGWRSYTTQTFDVATITNLQIVGVYSYGNAAKSGQARWIDQLGRQIGSNLSVSEPTTNQSFDTGIMNFSPLVSNSITLQIFQETDYSPYPTITVTCNTNTFNQ